MTCPLTDDCPPTHPHTRQSYYPECLQCLHIINSNIIFRAFWTLISPFIDERTKHKVLVHKRYVR